MSRKHIARTKIDEYTAPSEDRVTRRRKESTRLTPTEDTAPSDHKIAAKSLSVYVNGPNVALLAAMTHRGHSASFIVNKMLDMLRKEWCECEKPTPNAPGVAAGDDDEDMGFLKLTINKDIRV